VTEAIGGAAFHMGLGGRLQLRRVVLPVIWLDISELQRTNSSVFSADSIRQGFVGAGSIELGGCMAHAHCEQGGETHCNVAAGSDDLPLQLAVLRFRVRTLVAQQAAGRHKLTVSARKHDSTDDSNLLHRQRPWKTEPTILSMYAHMLAL